MGWMKTVLRRDLILLLFDRLAEKFYQFAAGGTDEMIVMFVIVVMFIAPDTITEPLLARQPAFTEQSEREIDGGEADSRILGLHQTTEVFSTEMPLGAEKREKDQLALSGSLQSRMSQVREEDLFFTGKFLHCRASPW